MKHCLELGSWSDENPRGEDGEQIAQCERGGKLVRDDDNDREEGKGYTHHEDARAEDHGEKGNSLKPRKVEHSAHFLRKRYLLRGLHLNVNVDGFVAHHAPQRVDRGLDTVAEIVDAITD